MHILPIYTKVLKVVVGTRLPRAGCLGGGAAGRLPPGGELLAGGHCRRGGGQCGQPTHTHSSLIRDITGPSNTCAPPP